ncbi:hypothetical protein WJX74_006696 [Apatococcus lobatus]|uniref:Fcf2 pre-rRNA processing C-terminal domain-containing protein n=1 Tax=Apatococcus lobatus TaxID=904363 RepID=A0AAW1S6N6_9CHLO
MVSLRSREVDSDSQATSGFKGTRTRSQKPSGGRSASLADTAQTPSRRSARLRGISEGEGHGSAASTPPLPSPELQSASQGAPPANSPKKPARSTRSTTKKECRNSDQAKVQNCLPDGATMTPVMAKPAATLSAVPQEQHAGATADGLQQRGSPTQQLHDISLAVKGSEPQPFGPHRPTRVPLEPSGLADTKVALNDRDLKMPSPPALQRLSPEASKPAAENVCTTSVSAATAASTEHDDSSHSEAESDDSSMGDSPASDAVQQLTAAMWNIFGQQPPGSATPDGRTPLPPVGAAAAAQHPVRTDAEGVEPQDIVEMHWHENGWMPPAPDADAAELTMVNKKQEAMASKLLIPLRDTAREKWERKQQETATAGSGWFNMKSSELNAETKRDLQLLKLRGAYDPKRFYKSSDHKRGFPAHFQMGTVVEGPTEFFSSRLTKRERQQNITQELLHDPDMNDARKRRFGKIQAELALGILSWIQTRTWLGIAASLCLVFSPSK